MDVDAVPGAIASDLSQVSLAQPEGRGSVRSCLTCSKAKAKCVKRPGTTFCERCSRLKKDCTTREPSIRKRKIIKTSRAAQLEQLENKIEHLVNALSASQNLNSQPSPPTSVTDNGASQLSTSHQEVLDSLCGDLPETRDDCSVPSTVRHSVTSASPDTSNSHNSLQVSRSGQPTVTPDDYNQLGVVMHEAELLFARWRRLMAPMFPFVVVPEDVTARQLKSSKPLLLHAIVTVAHFHDLTKQQVMVKQLIRNVSERILINNEKNLGILQSLLVFVSWYHPHIFWGQQVTNLLHLAMSLILDLGFDRAPGSCSDFKGATTKAVHGPSLVQRVPTLEEHRVLLGTYYLASMLGSSFKKMDSPKWTKYMTNCLDNLVQAREYDSDLLLVQLVRLQHLAEDITQVDASTTPVQLYAKAFEAELNHIKQSDPCVNRMPENQQLHMQYLTTEIFVWELSLMAVQENKGERLRDHLDGLYRCVSAIKAYVDEYFALPTDSYLTLPFSTFGQCAHAFITLTRIASLETDGWDFANCNIADFPAMVEQAAVHYEGVARSRPDGLQVHNECFTRWAHRLRWMKGVYEAKFSKPQPDAVVAVADQTNAKMFSNGSNYVQAPGTASSGYQQQPTPPDDVMWSGEMLYNLDGDFWDEDFWNSFGSEYNMSFQADMQMQMGYQAA
ncbi:hypothetical protein EJ03DRAFT_378776 [Teratosphaeria nubilosa]|uniref:Zn(2)-C6 fungal-type domain-containing protein n=1 Tax=Teratosphaeria nubilosa TaxID=161662 RepID=A0A6G1KUF1_9PEZI|nr:hypothetical protein EJ03DRAFT_378776 [Teratosphaeria nubilosa]